jgi:hypothetical protein
MWALWAKDAGNIVYDSESSTTERIVYHTAISTNSSSSAISADDPKHDASQPQTPTHPQNGRNDVLREILMEKHTRSESTWGRYNIISTERDL